MLFMELAVGQYTGLLSRIIFFHKHSFGFVVAVDHQIRCAMSELFIDFCFSFHRSQGVDRLERLVNYAHCSEVLHTKSVFKFKRIHSPANPHTC